MLMNAMTLLEMSNIRMILKNMINASPSAQEKYLDDIEKMKHWVISVDREGIKKALIGVDVADLVALDNIIESHIESMGTYLGKTIV